MKGVNVGECFGRLTIVKDLGVYQKEGTKLRRHYVECLCECGNKKIVSLTSLLQGSILSCGCLKKENLSKIGKKNKKYNNYKIIGDIVEIELFNSDIVAIIDFVDWNSIKQYCWFESVGGYIEANVCGKTVKMQRMIMNPPKDMVVDHINGDKHDNRKCNLRIVTQSENNMNKCMQSNNKSGTVGVYYDKSAQKWRASIVIKGNKIDLGRFVNKQDAIDVRKKAEIEYFGEYRYGGVA